ncbi:MAG: LuxR family transcriptional regulator [Beijerinckiaceae bacterium]
MEVKAANALDYLTALTAELGLTNAAYFAHTIPGLSADQTVVWTTYSREWEAHYFQNSYHRIDPVVAIDRSSLLPVDWSLVARDSKIVKRFFGEAAEFKVGDQGVAIPVRGPLGDRAIFAVSSDLKRTEWEKLREEILPKLVVAAHFVHHSAMQEVGVYKGTEETVRLAPRETACLRWAAAGKSFKDISCILGISERVTRAYLDTARHKLNALNITHAVSKAVSFGLIPPG